MLRMVAPSQANVPDDPAILLESYLRWTHSIFVSTKQSTANQDQDNEIPGYSERHWPVTNIWANPPNQSQQDKSKYKAVMLIDYQLNIGSCQTKWKYLKLVVLWIVVWQFPSCIIPARKDPSLNPSFFGNDQLVHIHTHTNFYTPVILHKHFC